MPRIARNIGLLMLSQGVQVAGAVVTLAMSARYLGVDRFGQQAVLRAMAMVVLPLMAGGLRVNLIRAIGSDPEGTPAYLGNLLTLRWAMVAVLGAITVAVARALPLSPALELAAYATVLLALAGVWGAIPRAVFVAYERNEYNVGISAAEAVLGVLFTLVAIRLDGGVAGIIAASAASGFVTAQVGLLVVYRRFVRPTLAADLRRWAEILRRSLPIGASAVLKRSYAQVDIWLLAALRSAEAAGTFSVAYRVTVQVTTTSILIGNAILPRISRLARTAQDDLRTAFERLLLLFLSLSVPAAGLLAALAQPLVLLVVGPEFASSVEAMRLVSIVLVTGLPDALLFFVLVALGRETVALLCLAVTVAANVLLDLALIPLLGVKGACLGTITAEWIYFAATLLQIHRSLRLTSVWRFVGKPVAAGMLMLAVIAAFGPHRPLLGAAGGLAVFGAALAALRPRPRRALRELRRALAVQPAEPALTAEPVQVEE
jgi:O-antigen/teichoic acid export membrane protein